jgi:glutaredoxin-related protein
MKTPILATSKFCGPCKILKSEFEKQGINIEYKDSVADVNFFIENKIKSVPTLVLVNGDKIVGAEAIMASLKEN